MCLALQENLLDVLLLCSYVQVCSFYLKLYRSLCTVYAFELSLGCPCSSSEGLKSLRSIIICSIHF